MRRQSLSRSFALVALSALIACGGPRLNRDSSVDAPDSASTADAAIDTSCASPLLVCAGGCTDPRWDPVNCGRCGNLCGFGTVCAMGVCSGMCPAPRAPCGTPARCVDITADSANCGACASACAAGTACVNGRCPCLPGLDRCGASCVDMRSDNNNCGRSCSTGQSCSAGQCCTTGQTACAGACVDLNTDGANCGACGAACPSGLPCTGGRCMLSSAPRPIAPMSAANITSRRPTLRWELTGILTGAHVELCRDRACTTLIATLDVTGRSGAPTMDLPAGVVFWRVAGRVGTAVGNLWSPTWEFVVGARSAAVDSSWGTLADVNGDGFADVFVGANCAVWWTMSGWLSPTSGCGSGKVYEYAGSTAGLSGTPATVLTGGSNGDSFGDSVASAGDVNGDGFGDVLVGASAAGGVGRAYLYLGGSTGLANSPAVALGGVDSGGYFGRSVASAGDVNGDGFGDIVVGAYAAVSGAGKASVFLGSPTGVATTPAATLTGPDGTSGYFGFSVASGGDVNGDGYSDLIVGAYGVMGNTGKAYVYLGSATGVVTSPSATLTGPDGAGGNYGYALAGAGDVNGDGFADVIVGAYGVTSTTGRAYAYLGGATGLGTTAATVLAGPDGANGNFASAVSGAGDVNGDGYGDVIAGAWGAAGLGKAYVFAGSAAGLGMVPASTLTSSSGGSYGYAVAAAGDVNGDGFGDALVGAYRASSLVGAAYLHLGASSGLGSTAATTLTGPDGSNGQFGWSVASAGRLRRRAERTSADAQSHVACSAR